MKQRPILFSTDMVKAILDGRKTQTRRTKGLDILNAQPDKAEFRKMEHIAPGKYGAIFRDQNHSFAVICPYGKPGDILWVRETWQETTWIHPSNEEYGYIYRASDNGKEWETNTENFKWKPSIHMPKKACRLFLEIRSIRVERLHDITEEDCVAEGVAEFHSSLFDEKRYVDYMNPKCNWREAKSSFASLWHSINGLSSWMINPWVWVIEFKQVSKPR